jgi:hypothetical protein
VFLGCNLLYYKIYVHLIAEGQSAHTRLNTQNVVVHGEHIERQDGTGGALRLNGNLRVIDAGEIARAGGLVLLGLQSERVRVHTGSRGATVMLEGLHLVEVLAGLLLEAVLTVEHQLEGVDGARELLRPVTATEGTREKLGATGLAGGHHHVTTHDTDVRSQDGRTAGEIPKVGKGRGTLIGTEDELLHGVVVGQTNLLRGPGGGQGVRTSVLKLLNQVLVALLGETSALLHVEVHVVTPHLEGATIGVRAELRRKVEIKTHLVVLEGDQGQSQTRVAVEEENQGEENGTGGDITGGGHLTPSGFLGLVQVQLGVQAPPALVMLVDALATDGQLDVLDGTLGAVIQILVVGGRGHKTRGRLHLDIHVGNEVTVAGHGHGDTPVIRGGTVDSLLDVLHSEVSVAAVDGLEKSNLGVAGQVGILSAVSDELHETTSHCICCIIYRENNSP